jgi:hypothetical protein
MYITNTDRKELLRELKAQIEIISNLKDFDFEMLSDVEIQKIVSNTTHTAKLLTSFEEIQENQNITRKNKVNLLKRMAVIFKYDLDLESIENLTDGQIEIHLLRLKKLQNYRINFHNYFEDYKK